ncbi:MAG: hypothetical protein PHW64_00225 [Sulfuricurvum sp.]|nr:hypothetical protein [Sulfuricurvum sp.]
MSSLSEQERIGLEEVFLSISSTPNFVTKWTDWRKNFTNRFNANKFSSPVLLAKNPKIWIKNGLKNHEFTKLLNKLQKRRKI